MKINGLKYVPDYLTDHQHEWVVNRLDREPWLGDLKRRVQHYGYKYDYRARKIDYSLRIGELPDWLQRLSEKLHRDGHMPAIADQVIINEYTPGQGISAHVDCEPCFKSTVLSMTVSGGCIMDFVHKWDKTHVPLYLEPKSIVILSGDARYKWTHAIAQRKSDTMQGKRIQRTRRVSLTFRNVILAN